jgi:glutathione-regulated potassium-efflux system ancillary protein KefC
VVSFLGRFAAATPLALGALGWSAKASLTAGTALSTTSLAVVYAVLVQTRLTPASDGRRPPP